MVQAQCELASSVGNTGLDPDASLAMMHSVPSCSLCDFRKPLQEHRSCFKLVPHLLTTVSYTFGATSAQVVALVFHRTAYDSAGIIEDIIWFGRLMNCVVAMIYKKILHPNEEIRVKLVPHKRKMLGSILAQECHSLREAQFITATTETGAEKRLSYTYFGGRVPWQLLSTYPLVTREFSLEVADWLMAVFVYLGNTKLMKELFVRRQNSNLSQRLSVVAKENEISTRVDVIHENIAILRKLFPTKEELMTELFPVPNIDMESL